MTHSPTPTELLALKTANAALLHSPDSFCDMVATVVFALGSAQLLQSPETAAELSQLRDRVAELEALEPAAIQTCRTCGAGYDLGQPCSVCLFKARMAAETAVRPCGCPSRFERHAWGCPTLPAEQPDARRDASVAKLRNLLAGQREEPHDSPLHHDYRLGHDLPEAPRV